MRERENVHKTEGERERKNDLFPEASRKGISFWMPRLVFVLAPVSLSLAHPEERGKNGSETEGNCRSGSGEKKPTMLAGWEFCQC